MTALTSKLCSDAAAEPLPGTAKTGSTYVLFEWPDAWSRDVLDGGTLGEELSAKLTAHLARFDATLLLIRHPTREGRRIGDHHVYLVFAEDEITEVLHLNSPEELLGLDLSGPGRNGGQLRDKPLLLVCTHAKRDACCAVKGRPLVRALAERYPSGVGNDVVWETSHIKGHRFAATLMLMPWAFSFGRMTPEAANALIEHAEAGRYFVPGNRGRGTLTPPAQAAEIAVAAQIAREGADVRIDQVRVAETITSADGERATVRVDDTGTGRTYQVALVQRPVEGVVDSCGKAPKTSATWEVESLTAEADRALRPPSR